MGISVWQLLIILLIIVLLFGTKKLRSIGKDMGGAVKGFRDAMAEGDEKEGAGQADAEGVARREARRTIEGEVTSKENEKV